ncbi:MAG: Asp23/Gls24 family envelope stress response protein [Ruminococcaceae bacterium]|nr:Asp23/Gls24 family envelope stress response protein [Oscillospiraceae bacterium]
MEVTTSSEKGNLVISEDVISSIAINAAKDVEGVSSFSNRPTDVISTIKKGSLKVMSPVRINQNGEDISVNIYVNIEPNHKIKTVAQNVQTNVKEAIQNMTGRLVSKVNVIIAGIDFEESAGSNEPNETED